MAYTVYGSTPGGGAPSALASTPQYSGAEIQGHINALQNQGLSGDALWQRVHQDAQQRGVSASQIDQAMGFAPGESQAWISANSATPLSGQAVPPTGLIGSEQALQGGMNSALGMLSGGYNQARQDYRDFGDQAIGYANRALGDVASARSQLAGDNSALAPFQQSGLAAQQLQSAMLGASGADAQAEAMANFEASPGQAWLRDQGEQAVLRNQSALGGLGGGNVMQELQRQGQGLASQQFNTRVGQLNQLGSQGLAAAGQQSSALSSLAGMQGQLGLQTGQSIANFGQNMAALPTQMGTQSANIIGQFAPMVAQGRTTAGQNLANIAQSEGGNIAQQIAAAGGNLASLLSGTGGQQATMQQNYAQLLANLASQQGGQVAGLPQVNYQSPNYMGNMSQLAGGIGAMLSAMPSTGSSGSTQPASTGSFGGGSFNNNLWNQNLSAAGG